MRKQKGFSLIELLIVVAIILIIAAIAIPNLLRARIAANESSAASSVRTVNTGEVSYLTTFPQMGYSATLVNLGPGAACPNPPTTANSCIVDEALAQAAPGGNGKSGYYVDELGGNPTAAGANTTYQAIARAITQNTTGVKAFCSFEDAVVRFQSPGPLAIGGCTGAIQAINQ